MPGRLEGKRALLTAAGAGIGRATALAFAREGATVIATDLDLDSMADLKDHGVAATWRLDVRDEAEISSLAADIESVDVLFNCAGYVHHGTIFETTDADWEFSFDINVKSMHRMIRAMLPGMLAKGGGSIINISSAASSIKGARDRYVYGTTKAAVIGLTKAVAIDFIDKGIRCNAICPGTVQSPSLDQRVARLAEITGRTTQEVRQAFIGRQPMGRLGTAEEIAAVAVYLAADESAFTTGTAVVVDGGWSL